MPSALLAMTPRTPTRGALQTLPFNNCVECRTAMAVDTEPLSLPRPDPSQRNRNFAASLSVAMPNNGLVPWLPKVNSNLDPS